MTAKYIERADAIRTVLEKPDMTQDEKAGIVRRLKALPAADVVERKPGVWIWDDEGYHCSECFFHAYGCTGEVLSGDWHYCPSCGAVMDGGQDDGTAPEPPKEETK